MVKESLTDERLIERFRAGGERDSAFSLLFERYRRPIATFFKGLGCDAEECQDLTQEVFVRVYQGMEGFKGRSSFRTWLYQVARNVRLNQIRDGKAKKRSVREVSIDELRESKGQDARQLEQVAVASGRGPLVDVIVSEEKRELRDTLQELPADQQRLVLLRLDQELSDREIADCMKIPTGTVKSRMNRVRGFLRKRLGHLYSKIDL